MQQHADFGGEKEATLGGDLASWAATCRRGSSLGDGGVAMGDGQEAVPRVGLVGERLVLAKVGTKPRLALSAQQIVHHWVNLIR
jgi:hypothetical protein